MSDNTNQLRWVRRRACSAGLAAKNFLKINNSEGFEHSALPRRSSVRRISLFEALQQDLPTAAAGAAAFVSSSESAEAGWRSLLPPEDPAASQLEPNTPHLAQRTRASSLYHYQQPPEPPGRATSQHRHSISCLNSCVEVFEEDPESQWGQVRSQVAPKAPRDSTTTTNTITTPLLLPYYC